MIKLCILVPRRKDLTREEFSDFWKNVHGPLFASQPDVKKHVRRYIQAHSTGQSLAQFPTAPYDGIAEIWFDSLEDITAVFGTQNYLDNIAPNEAEFIDRENIQWIYATEHVVMP